MVRKIDLRLVGLAGLVMAVALGVTACAGGIAPAAGAGSEMQNVITVNGQGQATGAPDIAFIELGIDVINSDLGQGVAEANQAMARVREAVEGQGVAEEDVQTTSFNVWVEDPRDEQGMPSGQRLYHVSNILRVKVHDIATVGDVIGAGLDAGANSIGGLSFGIDDPSELEAEARVKAVEDAASRAGQLADALGVQVGAPVRVSESFGGGPVIERAVMAADAFGAGAPPISEGQLTMTVTVTVDYLIQP